MKLTITMLLALCLLIGGCGAATEPAGQAAAARFKDAGANQPAILPEPESAPSDEMTVVVPIARQSGDSHKGRVSIAKTLSAGGVDQITIYGELCAVVLEQSAGNNIEAAFSFPKIAASNYNSHFDLGLTRDGNTVSISTDYENGRWDTAFEPISGFDWDQYRETAVLTVRLPQRQFDKVSIHLVTAGETLNISGVDASAVEVRIGTGDVVIRTDRAYGNLSVSHVVGNVTLQTPELANNLFITSKIGVFTLSLPEEPADFILEIGYDDDAVKAGDEAIYVLPVSWDAAVTGRMVHYRRGDGTKRILVNNQLYGVFAVEIDRVAAGEPASVL